MPLRISFLAVVVGGWIVATAGGAEAEQQSEVVRLAVTPAVEPLPSLKYQLLPKFLDRRRGNAALDYGRAIALISQTHGADAAKFEAEWSSWLDLPLGEFKHKVQGRDVAALRRSEALKLVRLAAECDSCEWQLPLREQPFFLIALPELQELRRLARLVALNVRLNVVDGDDAAAIGWLQVGYAMGRHAGVEPTLVSGLVGLSITAMMDRARLDLVQSPDAPSLYWADAFLPQPLVDLRPGLEAEMYGVALTFPMLREADRSPEEWNAELAKLMRELPPLFAATSTEGNSDQQWKALLTTVVVLGKTAARRDELRAFLVRCGRKAAEVEAMNDAQLLLEFTRLRYEQLRDDLFRRMTLPYAEARTELQAAERQLSEAKRNETEIIPLGAMILPAVSQVRHTYARADRRRDVLRIVEALRLYAGKHDATLPKSLADVTDVPLPKVDAVTGKPFDYVLDGGTARLTLPEENRSDKKTLVYEITVVR